MKVLPKKSPKKVIKTSPKKSPDRVTKTSPKTSPRSQKALKVSPRKSEEKVIKMPPPPKRAPREETPQKDTDFGFKPSGGAASAGRDPRTKSLNRIKMEIDDLVNSFGRGLKLFLLCDQNLCCRISLIKWFLFQIITTGWLRSKESQKMASGCSSWHVGTQPPKESMILFGFLFKSRPCEWAKIL